MPARKRQAVQGLPRSVIGHRSKLPSFPKAAGFIYENARRDVDDGVIGV
jgi:hypothetical protein